MPKKVDISHRTITFTVFFLLSLWILYQIREIIFTLFIAFILMAALNPTIERLERFKVPRSIGAILLYVIFFGSVGVVIAGIIPPLIDQTSALFEKIPTYVEQINLPWLDKQAVLVQFSKLGSIPENLIKITVNLFRNVISIFILAVITFYLLMERKNLGKYLHILFSGDGQEKATQFIERVEKRLGRWVRAEFILMTIIGVMSYVGLRVLDIDFALPLAVIAGFLEMVPNIGPTIAAIPAVIFGLTISPLYGAAVAALYFLIQQIENSFIVPLLAIPIFLVIQEVTSEVKASGRFPKT
jgi:predicted PurR-regulated permease PerM